MVERPTINGVSRRNYLLSTGAVISSTGLLGTAAADRDNSVDRHEFGTGLLISTSRKEGLKPEDLRRARLDVIREFASPNHTGVLNKDSGNYVPVSDVERSEQNSSNNILVGYFVSWSESAGLSERKFRAPEHLSREDQEEVIRDIVEKVENRDYLSPIAGGDKLGTKADGEGIVNADPGWGSPIGTMYDDEYVVVDVDNLGTTTLGQFNLFTRLWEAEDVDGKSQFGCALGCLQIPGTELEESNPAITNPQGFNYHTDIEQDYFGEADVVQYAPRNDRDGGTVGGVELESVTFGASGSGPYGEVSISPTETIVDEIEDGMQPAPSAHVETDYQFGSNITPGGHGGDARQDIGNSAVFLWEAFEGDPNINSCSIDAEFVAYPDDDSVYDVSGSGSLQETYTLLNID